MATSRKPKDPGLRDPDVVRDHLSTTARAEADDAFPKMHEDAVHFTDVRPEKGVKVSRKPGSSIPGGIGVATEASAAVCRPAGKRGQVEQFPTVGGASTTALVRNLVSTAHYQAAVNVRPGAEPGDPVVVVSPQQDDAGEIPPAWRPVIGYSISNVPADDRAPQITVREV